MAYLYRHIRLDKNVPFYIGIGADTGGKYKRAFDPTHRNKYWLNIVSISEYEVEILMDNISYDFAAEKEKEFISLYGRKNKCGGTLCNLTDGGDKGVVGMIVSQETRDSISKNSMGKAKSRAAVEKTIKFHTGRKRSIESRKNMSNAGKGKHSGQNTKSKITNSDAIEISKSTLKVYELCKIYGISKHRVSDIRTGRGWSNITGIKFSPKKVLDTHSVLDIYNSDLSGRKLAKLYNVSANTISAIKTGRNWGHITNKRYDKRL